MRAPLSPLSVTRFVRASPAAVYDVISDVPRMGELSPETVSATWLDGVHVACVGARFRGSNELGRLRWSTTPRVTVADRGREFAFTVPGRSGPLWSFRMESAEGGTLVTESMHQAVASPVVIRILQRLSGVRDRGVDLHDGMVTTLDRLALAVEEFPAPVH
jgi:hypothetical protein